MRILLIEDDPLVRETTSEALADAGYEVDGLEFAEDALVLLGSGERIDVLITDLNLGPGLSGIDLANIARSRYPEVELVFISGDAVDRNGRAPQPHEHLLFKPFPAGELLGLLEGLADRA